MRAICINADDTLLLEKGVTYFVFPNGVKHAYVSKFNNENAHFGSFHLERFEMLAEEEHVSSPKAQPTLDSSKIYRARLERVERFYSTELKEYFIKPDSTHAKFYHDPTCQRFCGSFPLEWFVDFEVLEDEASATVGASQDMIDEQSEVEISQDDEAKHTKKDWIQTSLF